MSPAAEGHSSFTVLDSIGALVAGGTVLGLVLFPLVGRSFAGLFEDFGNAPLPVLTRLATSVWFPPALAAPTCALLVLGLGAGRPLARRRLWVVAAFVLGAGALALCVVGLYLPVLGLAGAVRVE